MKLFTIGFTKKNAETFFELLKKSGVKRIIDIRLRNTSALAGFSKKDDLKYFLKQIVDIDYIHKPELAPTDEILDAYKKKEIDWDEYELRFLDLARNREMEKLVSEGILENGCLLCSEDKADMCHRRLVGEYLNEKMGERFELIHLK